MPCEDYLRQHNRRLMHSTRSLLITRVLPLGLAVASWGVPGGPVHAQSIQHLTITQPGGMPGLPVMTGVSRVTNGLSVTWDGPSGYYQLFQKHSLKDASWQALGTASLLRQATITPLSSNGFFRVSGPSPVYGSSNACAECHASILSTELNTQHPQAFRALQQIGQTTNAACLACHTVGYGLPTGFRSAAATPQLEGVQCENCHGPAANHAANYIDPTAVPQVELAATVCGGCHTGPQQPTYDEWTTSAHSQVVEDMNPTNRTDSCGRCHSGSARLSLLNVRPLQTNDANMPVVCVVCHDPHSQHTYTNVLNGVYTFFNPLSGVGTVISNNQLEAVYTNQLRNPLCSINNYSVTNGPFASQYNTNINLCAQCHNDRGASWTNWSYPPHHSLQYNMLLGTVGELASGTPPNLPGTHSQLEKQCVACHMQTVGTDDVVFRGTNDPPFLESSAHTLKIDYKVVNIVTTNSIPWVTNKVGTCFSCHGDQGQGLVDFMNGLVSNRVAQVKISLDAWATNTTASTVPSALTNYGTRAWQYANPDLVGLLSSGGPGPTTYTLQTNIPVNIQKARFNLYSVYHDGSGGVHNPFYILTLLDTAAGWVQGEMHKPSD